MSFGDRLQEVRRKSGLTQEQFAEALQVSRQAVSKWESGRGYPEIEKILYICRCYHVTPNDLFADEVPLPETPPETPPETAAEEPAPEPQPRKTLKAAFDAFFDNLSPKNKWLGLGVLLGIGAVAGLMALCLKGGTTDMTTIIWIAAIVIFGVAEAMTAGLVSIWFVIGSIGGLIVSVCNGQIWLQVTVFFVVSVAALIATRPLVRRLAQKDNVATNADRALGSMARVTETINNAVPTGAVYVDGKTWTARSTSDTVIAEGEMVHVVRMEGVKLIVEK